MRRSPFGPASRKRAPSSGDCSRRAVPAARSGDLQAIAWIALSGLGLGLVLPATIDTALAAVSDESSGVSSGVLQALRMVGGVLGAAILGAIINSTYRDQLEHAVPAPLASSAHDSAVTGVEVANASGSQALLDAVRESFVSGMSLTLWVSAALMAAGAVLALVLRPRPSAAHVTTESGVWRRLRLGCQN